MGADCKGPAISIHPPREGWDWGLFRITAHDGRISIHPPREGWDALPERRDVALGISIHPPREGWDRHHR